MHKLTGLVRAKDPTNIRQILNLPDDLSEQAKKDIRKAHRWSFKGVDLGNAEW
jgi:Skp1 family, dimerisation domain